jgi:Mrp family chromosome partitioning ATPase
MLRRRRKPVLAEVPPRRDGVRPGALSRSELEAFSALATALQSSDAVLAIGPKGRDVAVGLATTATVRGGSAALLECDLAEPTLASALGLSAAPGLREYLLGDAEPDQILQSLVSAGPAAGPATAPLVCVVAGAPCPSPGDLLASERCLHAVARLRAAYDLLVIAGPPLNPGIELLHLAELADVTLVCGAPAELPPRSPVPGAGFVVVG